MHKIIIALPRFTIEVTGDTEHEIFKGAALWLSLPTKCKICGAPLILDYRTPQTFRYYSLKCTGEVVHAVNLGQKQTEAKELYFSDQKPWEVFRPGQNNEHEQAPPPAVDRTTPQTTLSAPAASPAVVEPNSFSNRNDLIKLIGHAKTAGLRTGIIPADVGPMDDATVTSSIARVRDALKAAQVEGY